MKEEICCEEDEVILQPSETFTYHLNRYDSAKDIYYYGPNYWMAGDTYRELEAYRFQQEYSPKEANGYVVAPRLNHETNEIELDKFILPRTS